MRRVTTVNVAAALSAPPPHQPTTQKIHANARCCCFLSFIILYSPIYIYASEWNQLIRARNTLTDTYMSGSSVNFCVFVFFFFQFHSNGEYKLKHIHTYTGKRDEFHSCTNNNNNSVNNFEEM